MIFRFEGAEYANSVNERKSVKETRPDKNENEPILTIYVKRRLILQLASPNRLLTTKEIPV